MELTTGVHDVAPPKRGYFKAGYSKAVIVDGGDGLIVIDTLYDADAGDILDELKRMGKGPADIKHIVLTHARSRPPPCSEQRNTRYSRANWPRDGHFGWRTRAQLSGCLVVREEAPRHKQHSSRPGDHVASIAVGYGI